MGTFQLIRELLKRSRLAFFLGAGASLHSGSPEVSSAGPGTSPKRLPTAAELAQELSVQLGSRLPAGPPPNLIQVGSYFEILVGRDDLVHQLTKLLDVKYGPGRIHKFLAGLTSPGLIVTTNYDRFVERAFDEVGRDYHLVVNLLARHGDGSVPRSLWFPPGQKTPEEMDQYQRLDDSPIIFKIHGSLGLPDPYFGSFVISEEDYYEMAWREHERQLIPKDIAAKLSHSSVAFLGYRLGDIHIRHALLQRRRREMIDFAFTRTISEFEKTYWQLLGVDGFALDTDAFVNSLVEGSP